MSSNNDNNNHNNNNHNNNNNNNNNNNHNHNDDNNNNNIDNNNNHNNNHNHNDNNNNNNNSDDENISLLLDCAERGENRGKQPSPYICKVPGTLRDLSESSFNPQLVSIGPIHREDPKLQEFEWQKERYLNDLLNRANSTPKQTMLDACLQKVKTNIHKIRESYAGVKKDYSDVELARMMVMDGCFILEFCFKLIEKHFDLPNKVQNGRIANDLMLLENQVPFSVLQALFDCLPPYMVMMVLRDVCVTLSQVLDRSLARYVKLFRSHVHSDSTHVHSDSTHEHDHVLGYLHKRYHLVVPDSSPEDTAFHSAAELDRSGMKFKRHQENVWSMNIKFQSSSPFAYLPSWFRSKPLLSLTESKPTLLMPTLVINEKTELILRNFIAYEQSFPQDHRYYFTSYAVAMDLLIDTQEDIAKLVESKVLVNDLGSNQEAADMINKMGKNISFDDFYYNHQFIQMDKYYNGFWPKHIAQLRRVYFSNPWSIIALIAAIIMLLATVVSGIFAVLQYFG